MGFFQDMMSIDKILSKYTPIFGVIIYGGFMGWFWFGGREPIFNSFYQDITFLMILANQAVIVGYQTWHKV